VKSVSTLLWLVASASLFACGSADSSGRPGSGGGQGPTSSGQGGTSAGLGGTSATGSGGSGAITGSTSSGGSTGTSGGGVAGTIMTNTGNGSNDCGRKMFSVTPKPAEILIILDRSGSMQDPPDGVATTMSKWSQVVPAVNQVVTDTNATVSWGLKTFPEGAGSCTVTSKIDVNVAPMNSTAVTGAITNTTPDGDGTPTSTAIDSGVAYLKTLTDNNPKYILLATDGEPSCPGSSDAARLASVASVTNAFNAGFHTFVVGVATTKATSTTVLNQLADAGGEATGDANPLANRFYLASTKDAIVTTLKQITGVVASCSFDLGGPPPDVNNIAVKVAGDKAPQDATNGWSYTSPDNSQLTINGSWCDKVKASTDAVQIVFACPGDIIN
jgi:hypothetical protein